MARLLPHLAIFKVFGIGIYIEYTEYRFATSLCDRRKMLPVSKKLISASNNRLRNGWLFFFNQHPLAPFA
jgi:hypothetical protein